jgi:hypothetical protein
MASKIQGKQFLSLYKKILTLHKSKLSLFKKNIGDSYVKKEFRDHRQSKQEHLNSFIQEWTSYCTILETQPNPGKNLSENDLKSMSPEQKAMLEKLKLESSKIK